MKYFPDKNLVVRNAHHNEAGDEVIVMIEGRKWYIFSSPRKSLLGEWLSRDDTWDTFSGINQTGRSGTPNPGHCFKPNPYKELSWN